MADAGVTIRSYHGVLDRVERRLFRFERWRLPTPTGILLRSLVYSAASLVLVAVLSGVPLVNSALGLLPVVIHWIALPVGAGWALSVWTPDGRVAHHALRSLLRHWAGPRAVASLRRCPAVGTELVPVAEVWVTRPRDGARPHRPEGAEEHVR